MRSGSELLRYLSPWNFILFLGFFLVLAAPSIAGVWDISGGWIFHRWEFIYEDTGNI